MNRVKFELTPLQQDAFQEIVNIAACNATATLSHLVNSKIEVVYPGTKLIALDDIPEIVSHPEDIIVTIYMEILGGTPGMFLVIFPQEDAFCLLDLIIGQKMRKAKRMSRLEQLSMMQIATILSSSYFYAMGKFIKTRIIPDSPHFICDMRDAVINSLKSELERTSEGTFLIKTEIALTQGVKVKGFLFFIPYPETLEVVLDVVNFISKIPTQAAERRINPRVLAIDLQTYIKWEGEKEWQKVVCGNISLGGILLISTKKIPVNTPLHINIRIPEEEISFNLKGKVVWNQNLEPVVIVQQFKLGIQFDPLDEEHESILKDFVDRRIFTKENFWEE